MKIYLIIIFILIIISILTLTNNKQNIFVLTVDDIVLDTPNQINTTKEIIELLQKHDMPATFFVIPSQMIAFDFPNNIEIAQHGYTHYNNDLQSYSEFKGLTDKEVENRLLEGKYALEYLGYEPKGFRAPTLYFKTKYLDFMKEHYEYDSSFLLPQVDKFTIPIILDDPTQWICSKKSCSKIWLTIRKKHLFFLMDINDLFNKPTILLTHNWGFERLLQDKNGREYLDAIFNEINKRNYKKMTMFELSKQK